MKDHCGSISSFDGGDYAEGAALGRMSCGIQDGVECVFDVGGGERATVVEMDSGAQVENVGERIWSAPGVGEIAVEIHLVVALEEAAEEESVDFLGLGVCGEARIKVGGIGFD